MSTRPRVRGLCELAPATLIACVGLGCAGLGSPDGNEPLLGAGEALTEAPVVFGDDGLGPIVEVPAFEGESIALLARTAPGTCFAVSDLVDGGGRPWVTRREPGPYCLGCDVRTSLARDEALFVLPNDPDEGRGAAFDPTAGFALRFGLVRCDTMTPDTRAPEEREGDATLALSWSRREVIPARGSLAVRFVVAPGSALYDDPAAADALLAALDDELAEVAIEARLDAVVELDAAPDEVTFTDADVTPLASLLDAAPPGAAPVVDVVFAACLRRDDPFFGPPVPVEGYTPRVGGGAGPANAVFMPARVCDAPSGRAVEPSAHVLAHELGHFLGLYHSVEADGTTDLLDDTGAENTMHHQPTRARARGLTAAQGRVMRAHPWIAPAP